MKMHKMLYNSSLWARRKYLGARLHHYSDDIEMTYLEFGNPKGEVVVFLHGFSDEKHNFYQAGKILGRKYRVLVPDVPGFGDSTRKEHINYGMENYVRWFKKFFDFLGLKSFHLMGNSLGGAISIAFALEYPVMVRSMTLVNTGGVHPLENKSIYDEFLRGENIFVFKSPDCVDGFLDRVFYKPPFIPKPVKKFLGHNMYELRHWHVKLTDDFLESPDPNMSLEERVAKSYNSRLKEIKVPTLVIWGEHDSLFPVEVAHIIEKEIPGARKEVFKGIGHCPQAEAPVKFAKTVMDFVSRV